MSWSTRSLIDRINFLPSVDHRISLLLTKNCAPLEIPRCLMIECELHTEAIRRSSCCTWNQRYGFLAMEEQPVHSTSKALRNHDGIDLHSQKIRELDPHDSILFLKTKTRKIWRNERISPEQKEKTTRRIYLNWFTHSLPSFLLRIHWTTKCIN